MALDAATQARLEEELLKKTYSNPGAENSNGVDEAQKKRLLEVVNKEKEKPNKFTQIVSDFYNSYIFKFPIFYINLSLYSYTYFYHKYIGD